MQFSKYTRVKKVIFILAALLCFSPLMDPPLALLLGFVLSIAIGHPFLELSNKATNILLKFSIIGLGFGMNMYDAAKAGRESMLFIVVSIFATLFIGFLLGMMFKVQKNINTLICCGTAICGGSAIAVIAPVIRSKEKEISVALGVIFLLNSVALFLFPYLGHLLALSQNQFGWWAAIAIHDTSSVIGAAQKYGEESLRIATTIKLERALWIIPLSIIGSFIFNAGKGKLKIPYFIFLFVLAMIINTQFPQLHQLSAGIVFLAKKALILTLFLIGAGLTIDSIKKTGFRPLLQGVLLWLFISSISLWAILNVIPK